MELRHLRYFAAVVEEQNIGRAASRLHISQPPLSRQIQRLEAELGTLLVRTPRGVETTDAGRQLFEEARNILTLVDRAAERTKLAGLGRLGRIDIGVFGSNVLAIPELLRAFRQRHPTVNVALHTLAKNDQIEALRDRRISIGFSLLGAKQPDLVSRIVKREPVIVAVNVSDPLARRKAIALRDLSERPLLLYASGPRPNLIDVVFDLFHQQDLQPQIGQEVVDSLLPAIALVAAGYGVCLLPEWAARLTLPGVSFHRLQQSSRATIDLHAIYRRDDASPILRTFLQTLFPAASHIRVGKRQQIR